jgi:hypothetical protein
MENTPTPIDINKLRGILGNARSIMAKADEMKPITLSETTKAITNSESMNESYQSSSSSYDMPQNYSAEHINNSNLPDIIKRAMIDKPIPHLQGMPQKFTLEEMYDPKDEKEVPTYTKKFTPPQTTRQPINENYNSDSITVSKSQLDAMINEKILNFFKTSYDKALTEATIKRTLQTMIKEGLITKKIRI